MKNKQINQYGIIFPVTDSERMIVELQSPLHEVDCCYEADISFFTHSKKYILAQPAIYYVMQVFSERLNKVLHNKLLLHESLEKDIGYLFNEYSFNRPLKDTSFIIEKVGEQDSWFGYKYYLWSSCADEFACATWLYNNAAGDIVFEITPLYVSYEPEDQRYISYEKWIKNYKPFFVKTISRKIAQQWLEQANNIVDQIDINVRQWKNS